MQRTPPELTRNARRLRREATAEERALWSLLRESRPRLTRQLVAGHYIVDLACRSARIAVELDGGHHADQVTRDEQRTAYLNAEGWTVLRFWNSEVRENARGVAASILEAISQASTDPQPLPSREGS
ncbi:endonuclease domain-containing protein [Sphingomonas aracearum]|uniref:DUF559 domain-containing protein n=1 Tax=Sphingomonas aracearum TaxID=2283317 RepID=A0A369W1F4_9SPHN|nr:DUF559 domain-containing protein [Sphingomonas aracearum]RDE07180.1 DUF559 domain-containing protein [Sphingomonas aracearum]